MSVNFSAVSPYFKSHYEGVPTRVESPVVSAPVVEAKEDKKPKKGFLTRVKDGFISFRKGLIDAGYMFCGAVKGLAYGAVAGMATLGAVALRNTIKQAPKTLGLGGKVLAGAVGLVTLGITMFKAKLDANGRKADLDHRWRTGHNE